MENNPMTAKEWAAEKARLEIAQADAQGLLDVLKLKPPEFLVCGERIGNLVASGTEGVALAFKECVLDSLGRALLVQYIHDKWPEDFTFAMEDPAWKSPRIERLPIEDQACACGCATERSVCGKFERSTVRHMAECACGHLRPCHTQAGDKP